MKTILFITLILLYSVANCMTYYVSPDGIDHANYGTIEKPFKSIQFGVNQLSFGDTLIIRSGPVSYTHLRAHETIRYLLIRRLL